MALLGFKKQFKDKIQLGTKQQTIRADRKIPFKKGETLYMYCGLRTKHTEKILQYDPVCVGVLRICIDNIGILIFSLDDRELVSLYHRRLGFAGRMTDALSIVIHHSETEWMDTFARADGFSNWEEMLAFWKKEHNTLPFKGSLVLW